MRSILMVPATLLILVASGCAKDPVPLPASASAPGSGGSAGSPAASRQTGSRSSATGTSAPSAPSAAKPAGPRTGARTSSPSPGKTRAQGRQYRGSTSRLRVRSIPRRRALPDQAGVGRAASAPFPARGRRARHGPGEIEPASAYNPAESRPGENAMTQPAGGSPGHVDGRSAVVRQDLDNVLHPVVAHRQLEAEPLVIVEGHGSTVVDADGTAYLDAMAGLWCVNVGYGRTELADVAADQMRALPYYPHTAMNEPAAKLAQRVNGLWGGH